MKNKKNLLFIIISLALVLSVGVITIIALNPNSTFSLFHRPVSDQEQSDLVFIREEEKLARDVYDTLFIMWEDTVFDSISQSEQNHMDAILRLLNQYNIQDPVQNNAPGIFTNEILQTLYDNLTSQGSVSLEQALIVGATIEEIDIIDLDNFIKTTDHSDISDIYNNLKKGSENHLRAFVDALNVIGYNYTPLYLSEDAFEMIITSITQKGNN